ncbi:hypothetical protein H9P43_006125 [Blastocladiella emersonii ATCC 22665]|nr:hypothetical protein H9P43_006125 [Blastocladiella emersonii ATCC 22665]
MTALDDIANAPRLAREYQALADEWSKTSGIELEITYPIGSRPRTTSAFFTRSPTSRARFGTYVIWPPLFAGDLLLPLDPFLAPSTLSQYSPGLLEGGYVDGKLYALPYSNDMAVLYYRTDLLAKYGFSNPPTTWDEMETMLNVILPAERRTNPKLQGYEVQLSLYEGATCSEIEFMASVGAGSVIEADGVMSILEPTKRAATVDLMTRFRGWIERGLISNEALTANEATSINLWNAGNAVFMRNWLVGTFVRESPYPTAVAPLPGLRADLAGMSTNGANFMGVNRFTTNQTRAVRALEFLTGPASQIYWAMTMGKTPTIPSLLKNQTICAGLGNCDLGDKLKFVPRPSAATGTMYPRVSELIYTGWNFALSNKMPPDAVIHSMTLQLGQLLNYNIFGSPLNVLPHDLGGIVTIAIVTGTSLLVFGTMAWISVYQGKAKGKLGARGTRAKPAMHSLILLLAGVELLVIWPLTLLGLRTTAQCWSILALPVLGMTLTLLIFAAQDLQIYLIVFSRLRRLASDVTRTVRQFIAAVLVIQTTALVVWGLVSVPKPGIDVVRDEYTIAVCNMGRYPVLLAIPIVILVLLLAGCAWLTRRAQEAVATRLSSPESAPAMVFLYSTVVFGVLIAIPLTQEQQLSPLVRVLFLALSTSIYACIASLYYVRGRVKPSLRGRGSSQWMGATMVDAADGSDAADSDATGATGAATHDFELGTKGLDSYITADRRASGNAGQSAFAPARRLPPAPINAEVVANWCVSTTALKFRLAESRFVLDLMPWTKCHLRYMKHERVLVVVEVPGAGLRRARRVFRIRHLAVVRITSRRSSAPWVLQFEFAGQLLEVSGPRAVVSEWLMVFDAFRDREAEHPAAVPDSAAPTAAAAAGHPGATLGLTLARGDSDGQFGMSMARSASDGPL